MTINIFFRRWTVPAISSRGFSKLILAFTFNVLLIEVFILWANQTRCDLGGHYSELSCQHLLFLFTVFIIQFYIFFLFYFILFINLLCITFWFLFIYFFYKFLLYFLNQNLSLSQVIVHGQWFLYFSLF